MAFTWNPSLLNRVIAPGIAEFTAAEIPDLAYLAPITAEWLHTDKLFQIYEKHFTGQSRQYAVTLLHRAYACWTIYEQARASSVQYLSKTALHNPRTALYYSAVTQWESCLLTQLTYSDTLTKLNNGHRNFEPGDNTAGCRAYRMAQAIQAWSTPSRRLTPGDQDTVPLWLTNTGLHTRNLSLSFRELSRLIEENCISSDMICSPEKYNQAA